MIDLEFLKTYEAARYCEFEDGSKVLIDDLEKVKIAMLNYLKRSMAQGKYYGIDELPKLKRVELQDPPHAAQRIFEQFSSQLAGYEVERLRRVEANVGLPEWLAKAQTAIDNDAGWDALTLLNEPPKNYNFCCGRSELIIIDYLILPSSDEIIDGEVA